MSSEKVNDSEIEFELKSSFINSPSLEVDYRFVIQPETENKEESTHYVIWEEHVLSQNNGCRLVTAVIANLVERGD